MCVIRDGVAQPGTTATSVGFALILTSVGDKSVHQDNRGESYSTSCCSQFPLFITVKLQSVKLGTPCIFSTLKVCQEKKELELLEDFL